MHKRQRSIAHKNFVSAENNFGSFIFSVIGPLLKECKVIGKLRTGKGRMRFLPAKDRINARCKMQNAE